MMGNKKIFEELKEKVKKEYEQPRSMDVSHAVRVVALINDSEQKVRKEIEELETYIAKLKENPHHTFLEGVIIDGQVMSRCEYCSVEITSIIPIRCKLKEVSIDRHEAKVEALKELL